MTRLGFSTGTFDLPHPHHFEVLRYMRARCDHLTIGLTTDALNARQKRESFMGYDQRRAILTHCRHVDAVVANRGEPKQEMQRKLKFNILFIGADYYGKAEYEGLQGCEVIFVPDFFEHVPHTSMHVQRMEHQFLGSLKVHAWGLGGPLLRFEGDRQDVLVKPVSLGAREWRARSTADVYGLVTNALTWRDLPRNFKQAGAPPPKFPNLPGISCWRELEVHGVIGKGREWSPFLETRLAISDDDQEPLRTGGGINEAVAERARPAAVFWVLQRRVPLTMEEWLRAGPPLEEQVAFCRRLHDVVERDLVGELRLVHGDLHPSNVGLDAERRPYLFDWGWCLHASFDLQNSERKMLDLFLESRWDWSHFLGSLLAGGHRDLHDLLTAEGGQQGTGR